jgi:hypothetical protein
MEKCRLSVNTSGAFFHPLGDQTSIDCRYGEDLATVDLPDKMLLCVREKIVIPWGRIKRPRGIEIHNVSNQGIQVQPTEEQLAEMVGKVLLIGFGDSDEPALSLPPMIPGKTQFGGSQFLWLAPGASVWLSVPEGVSALARIALFPGDDDG